MSITYKYMETDSEIKSKAYVHWRSWQEAYKGIVDQRYLDALTLEKCESIAQSFPDNTIIAKDGDRVAGFACYNKYRSDELENAGEVSAIYILSEYYGQGVGYQLMQMALNELIEYPEVAVWVLKDNERATRFYKRCGFEFDGREKTLNLVSPVVEVRMILKRAEE